MPLIEAPCKGCVPPVRCLGCHSVCEKFKEYEKAKEEQKQAVRKCKLGDEQHIGLMRENKAKRIRCHR